MTPKENHRDRIARELAEALDRGVAPWVRPWSKQGRANPHNPITGTRYRGFNFLNLALSAHGSAFATFKQIAEKGGRVKEGAHGLPIMFWSPVPGGKGGKAGGEGPEAPEGDDGSTAGRRAPFILKTFIVFDLASDTEGMDQWIEPPPPLRPETERHETADALIAAWGKALAGGFHQGGGRAYYSPDRDAIHVPQQGHFHTDPAFYGTCFHEIGHATGAKKRLDRTFGRRFGDRAYAFEELIAELTAAFLCAEIGIDGTLQHAEYLGNWAAHLRDDGSAFLRACGHAQKAADLALAELSAFDSIAAE